jgi:hypothetical protein
MFKEPFVRTDLYIRLPDEGMDFIYSVACDGLIVESRIVPPHMGPTRSWHGRGNTLSRVSSNVSKRCGRRRPLGPPSLLWLRHMRESVRLLWSCSSHVESGGIPMHVGIRPFLLKVYSDRLKRLPCKPQLRWDS